MKIVILDGYTLNPGDLSWGRLDLLGDLTIYDRTSHQNEQIIKAINNADIVFTNKTPIPKEVLEKTSNLKYIGVLATGYNVVDINTAKELGIVVSNVPSYGTTAVAQMTLALILELCHHVGEHNRAVKQGEWTQSKDFCFWNYPLAELEGKTLGIIGYGRIGQATAKLAQAFGMQILASGSGKKIELKIDGIKFVSLEELLTKSDIISLHCPLTPETNGLINKTNISKMKDGVMIINTSRGQLVNENELSQALNTGKVYAAAVDVVSEEPIKSTNPLLHTKNCIITPHIAWASKEARTRLMKTAIDNLEAFMEGKPIHIVN